MGGHQRTAVMRGYSIQGDRVLDCAGRLWGTFRDHLHARQALDLYRDGYEDGRKAGAEEARREIRIALGVERKP